MVGGGGQTQRDPLYGALSGQGHLCSQHTEALSLLITYIQIFFLVSDRLSRRDTSRGASKVAYVMRTTALWKACVVCVDHMKPYDTDFSGPVSIEKTAKTQVRACKEEEKG